MESARDFVTRVIELPASMQHRKNDHGCIHGLALVLHRTGWNTAAVVLYGDRTIRMKRHLEGVAVAGQGFVDRVVDDLEDHLV